jgi:hypothetical protein
MTQRDGMERRDGDGGRARAGGARWVVLHPQG